MNKTHKLSTFTEFLETSSGKIMAWNKIYGGLFSLSAKQEYNLKCGNFGTQYFSRRKIYELLNSKIIVPINIGEEHEVYKIREKTIQDAIRGKRLRCLELSISEHCNYQCLYCTFWRKKNTSGRRFISDSIAERSVRDFLNITRNQENVVLYFGTAEPFLNWKTLSYIAPLARSLRPDISLNVITNGSIVSREQLQFCKDNRISVGISLDGLPETQHAQRIPASSSIDSSKTILKLLEIGKSIDFSFKCLSATYVKTGFKNDIDYLLNICKKYHIPEFDLDFDTHQLGNVDIDMLVKELLYGYNFAKESDLSMFGYWMIPYLNIIDRRHGIKSFCGNVSGESVCVSSQGEFKLCGYESRGIRAYSSFRDHLCSDEFISILQTRVPGSNSKCSGCFIEGFCNGHCMLINVDCEDYLNACNFYKKITKKLIASRV